MCNTAKKNKIVIDKYVKSYVRNILSLMIFNSTFKVFKKKEVLLYVVRMKYLKY